MENHTCRFNLLSRCRNINLPSIHYAFRPRVRVRLTLGGFTFPRKPYAFGVQDFHLHYRYSYRYSHLHTLHRSSRYGFNAECNALLPLLTQLVASVYCLFPIIYGATVLDQ